MGLMAGEGRVGCVKHTKAERLQRKSKGLIKRERSGVLGVKCVRNLAAGQV